MNFGDRLTGLDDRRKRALLYAGIVANTLVVLVLLFAVLSDRTPTRVWLFPVVWFAVGTWALVRTSPTPAGRRTKRVAGAIAVAYFAVLTVVGGLVGLSGPVTTGLTIQVAELPPGWNPSVLYAGDTLRLAIVPYTAFGYAVLSYLVYATAVEARGAVAGGLLGLFSCVSCTLPVIASLVGGLVGGGAALASAATAQSYGLSTVVFVVTVVLLSVRPGFEWLRQRL
ncbi:DUF7546 family protein [Natronomonas amylolytica]|uniref:DUF7546 family protein n=1 Tax=Natronomonas amylolytica TaxID=3108498 RepID=UPI00300A237B